MSYTEALFSFQGRMSRRDYWLKGAIILIPISLFNNYLMYVVGTDAAINFATLIGLVSLWPGLALSVKRLHDHDRSGWFLATLLIPVANLVFAIWILFMVWFLRGTVGPNRFGEDPEKATSPIGHQKPKAVEPGAGAAGTKPVNPVLRGVSGYFAGKELSLSDRVIIGRDAEMANLIYPSDYEDVSRQHCGISFDQTTGKFMLEDFSSNGTFLASNKKLSSAQPHYLNPGEKFYLMSPNESFEVNFI